MFGANMLSLVLVKGYSHSMIPGWVPPLVFLTQLLSILVQLEILMRIFRIQILYSLNLNPSALSLIGKWSNKQASHDLTPFHLISDCLTLILRSTLVSQNTMCSHAPMSFHTLFHLLFLPHYTETFKPQPKHCCFCIAAFLTSLLTPQSLQGFRSSLCVLQSQHFPSTCNCFCYLTIIALSTGTTFDYSYLQ